jgi:hypothetical protein
MDGGLVICKALLVAQSRAFNFGSGFLETYAVSPDRLALLKAGLFFVD